MSLLHPAASHTPHEVILDAMPPADIVTTNRAVERYADELQADLLIDPEQVADVREGTQALMRSIVRHSMSSPSQEEIEQAMPASQDTLDNRATAILDERINDQLLPETDQATPERLEFMARCLLRQQVRGDDPTAREEARQTLKWLAGNPTTREVVRRVQRPALSHSGLKFAGHVSLARFIPRPVSRPRLAR